MIIQAFRGMFPAVLLFTFAIANAQDISVSTQVFDSHARGAERAGRPALPITRSRVLFHAGKAYDCLDSGNQVTLFEPAQKRFVIIDGARRVRTIIPFAEIEEVLQLARQRAEKKLSLERAAANRREHQLTAFQIHPKFTERFDESRRTLVMESRLLSYTVKAAPTEHPELLKPYLDYADWAARLNFVVYPNAQFPNPRLELNEALRRRQLAPVEVTLTVHREGGEFLTAEHRFNWTLDAGDRETIRHWEKNLHDPGFKQKSLAPASSENASVQR